MEERIVMVCVDCLRSDVVNSEFADTPFIDKIGERGYNYRNLFSTTSTTTPNVASYMTGQYSENNGVKSLRNARLNDGVKTIASIAQKKGYQTIADVTGPIIEETGLDRGFQSYTDHKAEDFSEWSEEVLNKISSLDSTFFYYIHLWDIHEPIKIEGSEPKNPYLEKLSELDKQLQQFYDKLPEDTTLLLLGDHGESISYRKLRGKYRLRSLRNYLKYEKGINTNSIENLVNKIVDSLSNHDYNDHFLENGHGENIFDFATNVPFIIYNSEICSEEIEAQVRQVDIFPTLLDLIGADKPENIDGKSLLPPDEVNDRDAYIRACGTSLKSNKNWIKGIRSKKWKYVEYYNRTWNSELYNLKNDPKELNPVQNNEKKQKLREKIPQQ